MPTAPLTTTPLTSTFTPTPLTSRTRALSPLVLTTLQAILINIVANILAQLIEHRKIQRALSPSSFSTSSSSSTASAIETLALNDAGERGFEVDVRRVVQFVLWTAVSVPPNFRWQVWLERRFPGFVEGVDEGMGKGREKGLPIVEVGGGGVGEGVTRPKKRNVKNTFLKMLCDQGCAAPVNCASFLFVMTLLKGGTIADGIMTVRKKFWPLKFAGWRLWPMVGLINFTFVPVNRRVIVSTIVGLCWNVFLALFIS